MTSVVLAHAFVICAFSGSKNNFHDISHLCQFPSVHMIGFDMPITLLNPHVRLAFPVRCCFVIIIFLQSHWLSAVSAFWRTLRFPVLLMISRVTLMQSEFRCGVVCDLTCPWPNRRNCLGFLKKHCDDSQLQTSSLFKPDHDPALFARRLPSRCVPQHQMQDHLQIENSHLVFGLRGIMLRTERVHLDVIPLCVRPREHTTLDFCLCRCCSSRTSSVLVLQTDVIVPCLDLVARCSAIQLISTLAWNPGFFIKITPPPPHVTSWLCNVRFASWEQIS